MKYKRVLLKVSGEALSGKTPIDFEKAAETALQIKALHDAGCLLGVVVGVGIIGVVAVVGLIAAGDQRKAHHQSQHQCSKLFHG